MFDLLDSVFCVIYGYGYLDKLIEGEASPCCCSNWERQKRRMNVTDDDISDSLYERRNIFREMGSVNRWSDCGCDSCLSWVNDGSDYKLHFVVKQPLLETVFPYFSEKTNHEYRLIAIDLLGFGNSPKPRDCSYTLQDHMTTFHLLAHSMGCIIALVLAAKYPKNVKSITLVAPISCRKFRSHPLIPLQKFWTHLVAPEFSLSFGKLFEGSPQECGHNAFYGVAVEHEGSSSVEH
ncbi:hypothetical protein V8G54_035689 [Vigna mungo]|uniref:AB hydrolase-1 domain-containing protein n=1 Tax=Vigna mungo TaxID=3915 RepID=A0AAQ3RFW9_VIGMU